jgi:hypothetical protein
VGRKSAEELPLVKRRGPGGGGQGQAEVQKSDGMHRVGEMAQAEWCGFEGGWYETLGTVSRGVEGMAFIDNHSPAMPCQLLALHVFVGFMMTPTRDLRCSAGLSTIP